MDVEQRKSIISQSNISSIEMNEKTMVAMKVEIGIRWAKLKTMSRKVFKQF